MIDSDGFSNPVRRARHAREALVACHKGAGTGAAVKEQRLAREQSAKQFAEQMGLMRQQYEDARKIKPVVPLPAAPLPTGTPDAYNAGMEEKRAAKRRFGSAATILTRAPLGGAAVA
jgi:hypothetical protein